MAIPSLLTQAEFIAPSAQVTQRVDIYEQDGVTPFLLNAPVLAGTVSVSSSRAERRTLDASFDNSTYQLDHYPGGFWYDKVIKVYRGIKYRSDKITATYTNLAANPSAEVDTSGWSQLGGRSITRTTGSTPHGGAFVRYGTSATDSRSAYWDSANITGGLVATKRYAVRVRARLVSGNTSAFITTVSPANSYGTASTTFISQPTTILNTTSWNWITAVFEVAVGVTDLGIAVQSGATGGSIDFDGLVITQLSNNEISVPEYFEGNSTQTGYLAAVQDVAWETKLGEFLIDSISSEEFPGVVAVQCRDFTKKLLKARFFVTTEFSATSVLEDVIRAIALNGGIPTSKMILPATGLTIGRIFHFDAGSERWAAIDNLASSFGYECFFNADGYFVMRPYRDPVTSPITYEFKTGAPDGNLIKVSKKTTDSRIYNVIVVTGEATDTIPVYAVAQNTQPGSPTNVDELGIRDYRLTSSFITTTQQAQDVANKMLKIHALEEFEIDLEAIVIPWLEAGDIVRFTDPRPMPGDPDRYLLTDFSIPLGLASMSANGKRVTIVS